MSTVLATNSATTNPYNNFVDQLQFVTVNDFNPTIEEQFITVEDVDRVDVFGIRDDKVYWIEDPALPFVHVLDFTIDEFKSQLIPLFN